MIADVKTTFSLPYTCIARQMGLSYATLMRWKTRLSAGRAPVGKRGPKKVRSLNLAELKATLRGLDHGRKRTRGTGAVHAAYAGVISRRDLNEMVRRVRCETNRRRAAATCHITWTRPNLAWSLDDCRTTTGIAEGTLHLHNLSDLCSRYRLPPLAGDHLPCGEEVAGHLDRLFTRFGPPLFCKRDNGGNLNHTAVDQVLEDALVIPINNPSDTPSYNGAIEHAQGEFKRYLRLWGWKAESISQYAVLSETAAHDLNHTPRRVLSGKTACRSFWNGNRLRYPKRQRRAVYDWILDLAERISHRAGEATITPVAWRVAAKRWLLENNLIVIRQAGKVLPHFPWQFVHN